ncbi:hypothetical protein HYV83_05745 [Candidatus Woesearchaeota archaeon]|nr:hypothetical protein [Candidatus Woesearchaeota archaeon]
MPINLMQFFPVKARSLDDFVSHVEKSEAKWAEAYPRFIVHRMPPYFHFFPPMRRFNLYELVITYTSETKHGRPIVAQFTYGMKSDFESGFARKERREATLKLFATADTTLEWIRETLMERLPFVIDTYVANSRGKLSEETLRNLRHAANSQGVTPYIKY